MKLVMKTLTIDEVSDLLGGRKLGLLSDVSDLLPEVVLVAALENVKKNYAWVWCAPRIFLDEKAKPVGAVCLFPVSKHEMEIGYGTRKGLESQGIATTMVSEVIAFALRENSAIRFSAKTSVANPASARVLEKNSFLNTGMYMDAEDGMLNLWCR